MIASNDFLKKFPNSHTNLANNENRLLSNFDFYNTILSIGSCSDTDMSNSTSKRYKTYNILSEKIPEDRTCEDAGIDLL